MVTEFSSEIQGCNITVFFRFCQDTFVKCFDVAVCDQVHNVDTVHGHNVNWQYFMKYE